MNIEKIETKKRITLYGTEAREKILAGVDRVADAVRVTMGAKGRNVITSYGHTTKDGVTVAKDIELFDAPEAHGARLIKAASVKTCDVAGDGTTLTCVLAQKMIHEGMRLIDEGKDCQDLKREMEACKPVVLEALKAQSQPVTDIRAIANISANDETLGGLVAEAVQAVGVDGLVTIENTYEETKVEVVEGMQIDRGVFHPVFYTENDRQRSEYNSPKVLVYNGKLHDAVGLAKVLEVEAQAGNPVLIVANDYDEIVLRMLAISKMKGAQLLPIKAPMVYHDETLDDIAVYTGATIATEADGFKNFRPSWFGHVKSVVSTPERTIVRSDDERAEAIAARVASIYEHAKNFRDAEKRNIEKRASRLNGKMAIVKLAATTEEEGREVRDRIEDAIYASQAALEMGIVRGGGFTLAEAVKTVVPNGIFPTDGSIVIAAALNAPTKQIARNAGKNEADILRECKTRGLGYNVVTEQFEDFMVTGVVDPLKVVTTAFENALSVAVLALTTECIVYEVKE